MANNNKTYIDSTGLQRFLADLKTAYSTGLTGFTVKNAEFATYATGESTTIPNTYLKKTDAASSYMPIDTTFAGAAAGDLTGGGFGITKDALLTALNVADGAQVNVIESIVLDDSASTNTIANKVATLGMSSYAKKSDITKIMNFQDVIDYYDQLPDGSAQHPRAVGDVYIVRYKGDAADEGTDELSAEYIWTGSKWEQFGTTTVLEGFATQSWVISNFVGQQTYSSDMNDVNGRIDAIYLAGEGGADPTGLLPDEIARATAAEEALDGRLDILEGDASTAGSVAKSIADAIGALDYGITGASGQQPAGDYVTGVTQTDGVISVSRAAKGTITTDNTGLVDGGTVKSYVDSAVDGVAGSIEDLDYGIAGATVNPTNYPAGYYVTMVTQTDGLIAVTREAKGSVANGNTALVDGGTVYTAVEAVKVLDGSTGAAAGAYIDQLTPVSDGTIDSWFGITNS